MSNEQERQREEALKLAAQMYDLGYANGTADLEKREMAAFQAGQLSGYIQAVDELKPAVSDGLRNGSSECGRVMQAWQNMGVTSEKE